MPGLERPNHPLERLDRRRRLADVVVLAALLVVRREVEGGGDGGTGGGVAAGLDAEGFGVWGVQGASSERGFRSLIVLSRQRRRPAAAPGPHSAVPDFCSRVKP